MRIHITKLDITVAKIQTTIRSHFTKITSFTGNLVVSTESTHGQVQASWDLICFTQPVPVSYQSSDCSELGCALAEAVGVALSSICFSAFFFFFLAALRLVDVLRIACNELNLGFQWSFLRWHWALNYIQISNNKIHVHFVNTLYNAGKWIYETFYHIVGNVHFIFNMLS